MKLNSFCLAAAFGLGLGTRVAPLHAAECLTGPPTTKALAHAVTPSAKAEGFKSSELGVLGNFDRYRAERRAKALAPVPGGFEGRLQSALFDRSMGLPTFLWAKADATPAAVGALTERELLVARAREHLRREAPLLKLSEAMIADAHAWDAQYNGDGPAVVRFRQRVNGIDVFSRSLNVVLDRSGKPGAVSGYFATDFDAGAAESLSFGRSAAQAVASAWSSLGIGAPLDLSLLKPAFKRGDYEWFQLPSMLSGSQVFERLPRAKAVYYPRAGALEPAHYVELLSHNQSGSRRLNGYGLVVSANDGAILHRRNLVHSATPFNYTVFADDGSNNFHPWDSPLGNGYTPFPGAAKSDRLARVPTVATAPKVTLVAASGVEDPWLADDATETIGNNTTACIDVVDSPTSGLIYSPIINPILNTCVAAIGDIVPATTSANTFDYPLAPDEDPSNDNARRAAAVSLFYINNWLHDWWYVHGFNEEAGNAQVSNYGRGGEEGDPLLAQGQDASGRSNANMATPADGSSPTMQQYLFDGVINGYVKQVEPTASPQSLVFSVGSFTPASFDVPATAVVIANDGVETATDGCGPAIPDPTGLGAIPGVPPPPQASLAGAIALIDRGSCSFTTKARFAQLSGAAAAIIVNNSDGDPIPMGNADLPISIPVPPLPVPIPTSTDFTYTVPTVMITKADGDAIKALIAAGETVTMELHREPSTDLDGTLDNQIVAHEFFHYVHHRLTDSSNQQSGAMSEGWGDIDGFMLSVRPEDRLQAGNDRFQGAYGLAGYVVNGFYSGIRRAPYSTDTAKNAFTLKHISDGEPTPDGSDGASNSEVHNAGEVWANQMWECYVGLLNDPRHSFAEAQSRMKDYIIGGLKATPADATYTEARDAVLSVVLATDFEDYKRCSDGFAKRGSGLNAVAPARDSTDLVGVTEDTTPFYCKTDGGGSSGGGSGSGSGSGGGSGSGDGRFGGGALPLLLLLPMLLLGLCRRRARR